MYLSAPAMLLSMLDSYCTCENQALFVMQLVIVNE